MTSDSGAADAARIKLLPQENSFLRDLYPLHFYVQQTKAISSSTFLERLQSEILVRFPYRHPRYCEHYAHTSEEDGACLYGNDYWRFGEKLRHRMNDIGKSVRRTGKDVFPNNEIPKIAPELGLLELRETIEGIRTRLAGEGYLHPDVKSPYGRDLAVLERGARMSLRLDMYQDYDYAAGQDDDRTRSLRGLPGDINDTLDIWTRNTPAEFMLLSAWRNEFDQLVIHKASSPNSRLWVTDDLIEDWADYQRNHNSQILCHKARFAPPRVYGALDGSFKPWFPIITSTCTTGRFLLTEYIQLLALFQNIREPIVWETGDEEPDDSSRLINPARLPEGVTHLRDPMYQSDKELWDNIAHIVLGQRGRIPNDLVFQLLAGRSIEEDKGRQTWMLSDSPLKYGPANKLYLTRCIFRHEDDAQALREVVNMLPPQPDDKSVYCPFLTTDQNRLDGLGSLNEQIGPMVEAFNGFHMAGPVMPPNEYYDKLAEASPFIPAARPTQYGYIAHFGGRWLPKPFWDAQHEQYASFAYEHFSHFLRSELLVHEPSGTLFGGPSAVKWPFLRLITMHVNLMYLEKTTDRPELRHPTYPDLKKWRAQVNSDTLYLTEKLVASTEILLALRASFRPTKLDPPLWNNFKMARLNEPAPIVKKSKWYAPVAKATKRTTILPVAKRTIAEVQGQRSVDGDGQRGDVDTSVNQQRMSVHVELPAPKYIRSKTPSAMSVDESASAADLADPREWEDVGDDVEMSVNEEEQELESEEDSIQRLSNYHLGRRAGKQRVLARTPPRQEELDDQFLQQSSSVSPARKRRRFVVGSARSPRMTRKRE